MIDSSTFLSLRSIGLLPAVIQQALSLSSDDQATFLLRVAEVHREGLVLHDGVATRPARTRPSLRTHLAEAADAMAVGDWVLATDSPGDGCWVHARLPPWNQLSRRLNDGRDKTERQVIVSNVNTAFLVMGLDLDFNLRRLERYATMVRLAGVTAVAVLTKRDLCADLPARLAAARTALSNEVALVAVNALREEPGLALSPWLDAGQTVVLLGSSGTGKSTLTNALVEAQVQLSGGNRQGDGRGRHTTTARSLHATPRGACIIDTPGLRTLRLDGEVEAVAAVFDDITRLAAHCRFRDCQHQEEPGCAVRDSVEAPRLRNYHKLLREARRDSLTALERQAQVRAWKARGRSAALQMAVKRRGSEEA